MKQGFNIIVLMMLIFISGQSLEVNRVHAEQEEAETVISNEREDQTNDSIFDGELADLASEGKLKHAEYPIGTNINEIIANSGDPDEQGIWGGANYFVYDNVMYFVPFDQEVVTSIEVDLSPDESPRLRDVESLFGHSTKGIEISELDNRSFLLYEFDQFILYIEAGSESTPVETLFLKQK